MNLAGQARAALRAQYSGAVDQKGYVPNWKDNLLPGIEETFVEGDLRSGAGQELQSKFRALHSSSALAVNTFGPFKSDSQSLVIGGQKGFRVPTFEKKLVCFDKQLTNPLGCPHLDVWLEQEKAIIAIESKFLEYLTPKQASFSASYTRAALPQIDDHWWNAMNLCLTAGAQLLDVAQLVKHAFALLRYRKEHRQQKVMLLYLFWEPTNASQFSAFETHRQQLFALSEAVATSDVPFRFMTYHELWQEWDRLHVLPEHLAHLRSRYEVAI